MISNKDMPVETIVKARCPRCGKLQNHTVIEVVDEQTTRIRCNACREICISKGKKTQRSPKTARREVPATTRARAAQTASERDEWACLRPRMHSEEAIPYRMNGTYHVRDLVQHGSFGLGLVTRQAGPRKIEVLFQEGKKLLCCR